jgi:hypothetical protein
MRPLNSGRARLALWFAALLVLSLLSRWRLEARRSERCSLDGGRIVPIYQVDLVLADQVLERFCCLRCAGDWPEVPAGAYWRVRDEVTGRELDASVASFVDSPLVTVAARQCRLHAFERWADASSHVAAYGGERVPNPLPTPGKPASPPQESHDANDD